MRAQDVRRGQPLMLDDPRAAARAAPRCRRIRPPRRPRRRRRRRSRASPECIERAMITPTSSHADATQVGRDCRRDADRSPRSLLALAVAAPAQRRACAIVAPFPLDRYAGERGDRARRSRRRADRDPRERAQHAAHRQGRELAARRRPDGHAADRARRRRRRPTRSSSLPPPGRRRERPGYPIAVVPGADAGVLTSNSTRIDGLVSLADVAQRAAARWSPSTTRSRRSSGSSAGSTATTASAFR